MELITEVIDVEMGIAQKIQLKWRKRHLYRRVSSEWRHKITISKDTNNTCKSALVTVTKIFVLT